jgi:hypothetical protein
VKKNPESSCVEWEKEKTDFDEGVTFEWLRSYSSSNNSCQRQGMFVDRSWLVSKRVKVKVLCNVTSPSLIDWQWIVLLSSLAS